MVHGGLTLCQQKMQTSEVPRPSLEFIGILLLWLLAFYPILPELATAWIKHSDNSHSLLVPLISLYLLWKKREDFKKVELAVSHWGAVILMASMLTYIVSYAGAVAVIARAMLVFSLMGLVLYNFGRHLFRIALFPLAFLLFLVPVPDSVVGMVAFPLQLFATDVSAHLISAMAIPVYQEGNMLHFVQTNLEVAEACSGIRSIMAMLMISTLFFHLSSRHWSRRIVLIAAAIPVAILANIIRVSGTGVLAHFYGDKVARGFLHEFSGMAVFAFGVFVLLSIYLLLERTGLES